MVVLVQGYAAGLPILGSQEELLHLSISLPVLQDEGEIPELNGNSRQSDH
jgi:hypothetical protein